MQEDALIIVVFLLVEWNLLVKTTLLLTKHFFDRDFPQRGTILINYLVKVLHWKIGGKQENRSRNILKIVLVISV
jgi:hypothetical protein